ncbi:MAG TPA: alkaline phosphatase [Syntrophobacteria bacterium]|nr:alkaline phosphatase [Syntrophobacteria bacterium]
MTKGFGKPLISFLAVVLTITLLIFPPAQGAPRAPAKNLIVLIVDGCSGEQYTLARWFKGEPLALDGIRVGAVKTYIADSVVADSAPAASAFATGFRTSDKFISVGPREETLRVVPKPAPELRYRPLATVLEGAKLLGKSTGIVATSRVSDATPAAYMAHVPSREREDEIMEQAVYQNLDVVFGGGKGHLLGREEGGRRADGGNLLSVLKDKGYRIVDTRDEMVRVKAGRAFGLFAVDHMEAEIDRMECAPQQPTLEEMTRKAIELLAKNPCGFFLMVEASQVDWAGHANDPAHLLSDLLMYDRAVGAALDFARRDGKTLVLALSDHNTGGMTIGNYATSNSYSRMKLDLLLEPLKRMKLSAFAMWKKLENDRSPERVKAVVEEYWGLQITGEQASRILTIAESDREGPEKGFGEVLCPAYTALGWTTHGHTGGDVPLHAFGPGRPAGLLDGPDIGRICAKALGLDLDKLNSRLFVDADKPFKGGKVFLDRTDTRNPVVKVEFKGKTAALPVNKNLVNIGNVASDLEGVVVYAPDTDKVYLPLQAVYIIKGTTKGLPHVTLSLPAGARRRRATAAGGARTIGSSP